MVCKEKQEENDRKRKAKMESRDMRGLILAKESSCGSHKRKVVFQIENVGVRGWRYGREDAWCKSPNSVKS